MSQKPLLAGMNENFRFPYLARQATTWVADPAIPGGANASVDQTGPIRKGETIWLQSERFGSGPSWQVARLANDRVCLVQPHHFDSINP